MTNHLAQRLETRDAGARGLRVEFVRRGDRYAHVISLLDGESVMPAWESVEGTDADNWPPSPALQQLSAETLAGGRRVLLLVGMAGTSHWSLSVEAACDSPTLIFDAACRVKHPPEWLGNEYRALDGDARLLHWSAAPEQVELITGEQQVTLQPAQPALVLPATLRWSYRIALSEVA